MNVLSIRRTNVLTLFKLKTLFANSYVMSFFVLPIAIAVLLPIIYKMQLGTSNLPPKLMGLAAQMAGIVNIGAVTLTMPILQMAEEKEKHTLRNLMVSSIKPAEYLISSLIPTFLVSFIVQLAFLPMLKAQFSLIEFLQYAGISAMCILISCLLGLSFGLFAKDQMSASTLPMPLSMVIMGASMFGGKFAVLKTAKEFIYANVATDVLTSLVVGEGIEVSLTSILAIIVEIFLATMLFILLYKKNGFESD